MSYDLPKTFSPQGDLDVFKVQPSSAKQMVEEGMQLADVDRYGIDRRIALKLAIEKLDDLRADKTEMHYEDFLDLTRFFSDPLFEANVGEPFFSQRESFFKIASSPEALSFLDGNLANKSIDVGATRYALKKSEKSFSLKQEWAVEDVHDHMILLHELSKGGFINKGNLMSFNQSLKSVLTIFEIGNPNFKDMLYGIPQYFSRIKSNTELEMAKTIAFHLALRFFNPDSGDWGRAPSELSNGLEDFFSETESFDVIVLNAIEGVDFFSEQDSAFEALNSNDFDSIQISKDLAAGRLSLTEHKINSLLEALLQLENRTNLNPKKKYQINHIITKLINPTSPGQLRMKFICANSDNERLANNYLELKRVSEVVMSNQAY